MRSDLLNDLIHIIKNIIINSITTDSVYHYKYHVCFDCIYEALDNLRFVRGKNT